MLEIAHPPNRLGSASPTRFSEINDEKPGGTTLDKLVGTRIGSVSEFQGRLGWKDPGQVRLAKSRIGAA